MLVAGQAIEYGFSVTIQQLKAEGKQALESHFSLRRNLLEVGAYGQGSALQKNKTCILGYM